MRVVALSLLALVACRESPEESAQLAPSASPESQQLWKRASAFADKLTAMRAELSDASKLSEKPCQDDALKRHLGSGAGLIALAEYEYLDRYSSPTVSPRYRGAKSRWKLLTTPVLRDIRAPVELESRKSVTDAVFRMQELADSHPYVGVVRTTRREPPRIDGEKFVPGKLDGWVGVFELASGQAVCQASFSAITPEEIAFADGTAKDEAIWNDFSLRIRQALDSAVGRITRHLVIDWG